MHYPKDSIPILLYHLTGRPFSVSEGPFIKILHVSPCTCYCSHSYGPRPLVPSFPFSFLPFFEFLFWFLWSPSFAWLCRRAIAECPLSVTECRHRFLFFPPFRLLLSCRGEFGVQSWLSPFNMSCFPSGNPIPTGCGSRYSLDA